MTTAGKAMAAAIVPATPNVPMTATIHVMGSRLAAPLIEDDQNQEDDEARQDRHDAPVIEEGQERGDREPAHAAGGPRDLAFDEFQDGILRRGASRDIVDRIVVFAGIAVPIRLGGINKA
jgi:hypothetical protein